MKKVQVLRWIVLVCLVIFVGQYLIVPKDSTTPFKTVAKDSVKDISVSDYTIQENRNIRRFLSLDPSTYQHIRYYKNKDTMQSSEIVIVQFKSDDQADDFKQAMQKHVDDQIKIFDGYLPKEADLLKQCKIVTQANYGIYVTNKKADTIVNNWQQSLKKGD